MRLELLILPALLPLFILPSFANVSESTCSTDIQMVKMKDEVTIKVTADSGCSSIYAFYITARSNEHFTVHSSPAGWFGGEIQKEFIIWTTEDNPILPGKTQGNFVIKVFSTSPYQIGWSVADKDLNPFDWGIITIQ